MPLYNQFYIAKPQTKAFYIVQVASRHTVKPEENFTLVFWFNANTIILNFDLNTAIYILAANHNFRRFYIVFDGVIQQIKKHVGKVKFISSEL